ncbi:CoA-binding protein [Plesiomonas shigelloides]|uniref:CoA-binding protein n=1 Tax=Plesiomonas shigelloides TaxID=703 RepID=UPI001261DBE1|nr:CoA-binding protein [Plesiomonas shigelloides]KAB7665342.1 CoA-binding protein [Plesiomonas shigelloides]
MHEDLIREVLQSTRTIALVGASHKPERPSYRVMAYLLEQGYHVIPVNPGLAGQQLLGQEVKRSLAEIDEPVDMVDVFRSADAAYEIAGEAIAIGAKSLWLQLGVINEEASALAQAAGLKVVMNHCPKIEIPRLGLEKA